MQASLIHRSLTSRQPEISDMVVMRALPPSPCFLALNAHSSTTEGVYTSGKPHLTRPLVLGAHFCTSQGVRGGGRRRNERVSGEGERGRSDRNVGTKFFSKLVVSELAMTVHSGTISDGCGTVAKLE